MTSGIVCVSILCYHKNMVRRGNVQMPPPVRQRYVYVRLGAFWKWPDAWWARVTVYSSGLTVVAIDRESPYWYVVEFLGGGKGHLRFDHSLLVERKD